MACALVSAAGAGGVRAAGVAVLKEWSYHRDCSARPVVYSRIIDSHGPYLRLVTGSGNVDILRTKLADHLDVPQCIPACLVEEKDIAAMRTALAAMKEFSARYPLSAPLLEPACKALSAHVALFDAGEVRFEGQWMGKDEFASLMENRRREAEAARMREIERVILNEQQKERGLVLMDGSWVTEKQRNERPASARTELSDTLWPLFNPTMDGARMAVENLSSLAAGQTGAAKVRTERVRNAVRNVFAAEASYCRQVIASSAAEATAATHERHAAQWLKPNAFGTVRTDEARESRAAAAGIRNKSSEDLAASRGGLMDQVREMDTVTCDLFKLREHRAALILAETAKAVAARRFPSGEFQPSLSDPQLAAIREEMARENRRLALTSVPVSAR